MPGLFDQISLIAIVILIALLPLSLKREDIDKSNKILNYILSWVRIIEHFLKR